MPLSARLRNIDLTLECKHCAYLIIKKGGWFMTVSNYKCTNCRGEMRLTYSDKVALFAKHAHLA
jgi:hypothetical protein